MKIPILHLEDGIHNFEHDIKAGTFHFDQSEIFPGDINVKVKLNKFDKNITCKVKTKTKSHNICDRCLTEYDRDHEGKFTILFHLGEKDFETDEEDVILISPDQIEIDLMSNIYEHLILSIPMKSICKEECQGLCSECGVDLNNTKCSCHENKIDPRWESLKNLKINNN